ncbi:hypothetical protein Hte_007772 [Hypoxylon texense]
MPRATRRDTANDVAAYDKVTSLPGLIYNIDFLRDSVPIQAWNLILLGRNRQDSLYEASSETIESGIGDIFLCCGDIYKKTSHLGTRRLRLPEFWYQAWNDIVSTRNQPPYLPSGVSPHMYLSHIVHFYATSRDVACHSGSVQDPEETSPEQSYVHTVIDWWNNQIKRQVYWDPCTAGRTTNRCGFIPDTKDLSVPQGLNDGTDSAEDEAGPAFARLITSLPSSASGAERAGHRTIQQLTDRNFDNESNSDHDSGSRRGSLDDLDISESATAQTTPTWRAKAVRNINRFTDIAHPRDDVKSTLALLTV